MEVHTHPQHTEKKNWKTYLWEFLMLFLAVFCGFMAENIREHKVEHERAKELAINLYKETLADSATVQHMMETRKIKENECSYFIAYVKDSSLTHLNDHFFHAFSWALIQTSRILFEPNDGILNQLKNSGELRYFKSPELQAAVGELSVAIANVRNRNDKEYSMVELYVRQFSLKYYDFTWYNALTQNGTLEFYEALMQNKPMPFNGKIPNLEKFDRKEAENLASYYLLMLHSTRVSQYTGYANSNHKLLQILRTEYHLES
jgi:hypothetical protein